MQKPDADTLSTIELDRKPLFTHLDGATLILLAASSIAFIVGLLVGSRAISGLAAFAAIVVAATLGLWRLMMISDRMSQPESIRFANRFVEITKNAQAVRYPVKDVNVGNITRVTVAAATVAIKLVIFVPLVDGQPIDHARLRRTARKYRLSSVHYRDRAMQSMLNLAATLPRFLR